MRSFHHLPICIYSNSQKSAIIVTIGGYDISQVEHRVVYIMGSTWRYYSHRQEAITLQENGNDFFVMLAEREHTTVEKIKENMGGPARSRPGAPALSHRLGVCILRHTNARY